MEVLNATVHELIKTRNIKGAEIDPAESELAKGEALDGLLSKVLQSYNNRCSRHSGSFEADQENYRFSANLKSFLDKELNFVKFTETATNRLKTIVNDIIFASGGYILYVHYKANNKNWLLAAKLSKEDGAIFSQNLQEVVESKYLNLDRLQVAARIDIDGWKKKEERYLTFVMKQENNNPSDYFKQFIGCKIDQDSKEESKKIVKVIKDFVSKKLEQKAITPEQVPDIQQRAFDYAEGLRKNDNSPEMHFDALANAIWPDEPEDFLGFLNDHPEKPSTGFIPDRTVMRGLSNINFKSKELTLKSTYHFKQEHIKVEGFNVIIENAPEKLILELTGDN